MSVAATFLSEGHVPSLAALFGLCIGLRYGIYLFGYYAAKGRMPKHMQSGERLGATEANAERPIRGALGRSSNILN